MHHEKEKYMVHSVMRKWEVEKPTDKAKMGTAAVCPMERMIKIWNGSGQTVVGVEKWCIIA